jgi:hypothetical protein
MVSTTRWESWRTQQGLLLTHMQMALPEKAAVEQADYKPLETIVSSIVKEKQAFQRLTLSKEDL